MNATQQSAVRNGIRDELRALGFCAFGVRIEGHTVYVLNHSDDSQRARFDGRGFLRCDNISARCAEIAKALKLERAQ